MKSTKLDYLWFVIPIVFVIALISFISTRPTPGESIANQGNKHLKTPEEQHDAYNTKPPTSGPHLNEKARWGVHIEQIDDELQIHNLEDGGVIVHYDPTQVDETTIQTLTDIVENENESVILEPYADLETPIVLTAWMHIDKLTTLDEQRIKDFISAYKGVDHHVKGQ